MIYQLERLDNPAQSQTLLTELFTYLAEHYDATAQVRSNWQPFFQLWAGQVPDTKIHVFTARNQQGEITGCVMALVQAHPLFIAPPFIHRFVDFTQGDNAFEDYIQTVLAGL